MELTAQEKTVVKCCIMCEIRERENNNTRIEAKAEKLSDIDVINFDKNSETIKFLYDIVKKIK